MAHIYPIEARGALNPLFRLLIDWNLIGLFDSGWDWNPAFLRLFIAGPPWAGRTGPIVLGPQERHLDGETKSRKEDEVWGTRRRWHDPAVAIPWTTCNCWHERQNHVSVYVFMPKITSNTNIWMVLIIKLHASTNSTQKLELIGRDGQLTYTSTLIIFKLPSLISDIVMDPWELFICITWKGYEKQRRYTHCLVRKLATTSNIVLTKFPTSAWNLASSWALFLSFFSSSGILCNSVVYLLWMMACHILSLIYGHLDTLKQWKEDQYWRQFQSFSVELPLTVSLLLWRTPTWSVHCSLKLHLILLANPEF